MLLVVLNSLGQFFWSTHNIDGILFKFIKRKRKNCFSIFVVLALAHGVYRILDCICLLHEFTKDLETFSDISCLLLIPIKIVDL